MSQLHSYILGSALATGCGVLCARFGILGLTPGVVALFASIIPLRRKLERRLQVLPVVSPILREVLLDAIPRNPHVGSHEIIALVAERIRDAGVDERVFTDMREDLRRAIPGGVQALRGDGSLRTEWLHSDARSLSSASSRLSPILGYSILMFGTFLSFIVIFNPPELDATGKPLGDPTPLVVAGLLIALGGIALVIKAVRAAREPPN